MKDVEKEMLPYQQRVIDEKKVLDIKLELLVAFLAKPQLIACVGINESKRLSRQAEAMKEYSAVLGERIGAM